ncbi:MAG TPA: hypothetical protein VF244_10490 [Acidimicrobiales bacterium]
MRGELICEDPADDNVWDGGFYIPIRRRKRKETSMTNLTANSDNIALINLSLASEDAKFLRQAACDNAEWAADLLTRGADPEWLAQAQVRATLALTLATLAVTAPKA